MSPFQKLQAKGYTAGPVHAIKMMTAREVRALVAAERGGEQDK